MLLPTAACMGLLALACAVSSTSITLAPAHTTAAMRSVSPHYISFALDNAFVRDPHGIGPMPLPPDQTNSTRIDFQDPLLNTVMPLVAGGYIRIGGTYTDFVHYYVPGTNYTRCPYKPGTCTPPAPPHVAHYLVFPS